MDPHNYSSKKYEQLKIESTFFYLYKEILYTQSIHIHICIYPHYTSRSVST